MRPPEWMSTTISERGNSSRVRKSASCSSSVPVGDPGNDRFMLAPEGQHRVKASEASGETQGMTITRPETCSGRRSRARLIAAICPSGSSPWTPPRTSAVGPLPFATTTIGTVQAPVALMFDERGISSSPNCLPGASRSTVQRTGESLIGASCSLEDC